MDSLQMMICKVDSIQNLLFSIAKRSLIMTYHFLWTRIVTQVWRRNPSEASNPFPGRDHPPLPVHNRPRHCPLCFRNEVSGDDAVVPLETPESPTPLPLNEGVVPEACNAGNEGPSRSNNDAVQGSSDDIPMDIVELMARNQHERTLSNVSTQSVVPPRNVDDIRRLLDLHDMRNMEHHPAVGSSGSTGIPFRNPRDGMNIPTTSNGPLHECGEGILLKPRIRFQVARIFLLCLFKIVHGIVPSVPALPCPQGLALVQGQSWLPSSPATALIPSNVSTGVNEVSGDVPLARDVRRKLAMQMLRWCVQSSLLQVLLVTKMTMISEHVLSEL